ncbi:hypothetical protein [Klebsiella variicola]|uniref:hypothetical protein n=1 Tax=Klebsiella variicola TaxID=244366 RepID=UPI001033F21E|nr:hypothetical protein [Klebsiella variicola]
MNSLENIHQNLLDSFGLTYFQNCDFKGRFPTEYFNSLKDKNALYHLITDYHSASSFIKIASLIGEYSISASLCWVMHNQQSNSINKLNPNLYVELLEKQSLIASATSEYAGNFFNNLTTLDHGLKIDRQAPVCSYRHNADYFLVSVKHKDLRPTDRYLVLLPKEDITITDEINLSTTRSTGSGPIKITQLIGPEKMIGKFSSVFSSVFVPIGHIGWMSSYHGGLTGVLARLRNCIRNKNSNLKIKSEGELFRNRIAQTISLEYMNRCLIQDVLYKTYNDPVNYPAQQLNIVKTEVSQNLRDAVRILEDALGSKYTMTPFDEIGAEIFCRDGKAACLMVHNDMFYRDIYDLWLINRSN